MTQRQAKNLPFLFDWVLYTRYHRRTVKLLTYQEAAERLSVGPRTIEKLVKLGRMPVFRDGRKFVRIPEAGLERYINSKISTINKKHVSTTVR